MLPTSASGSHTSSKNFWLNVFSRWKIGTNWWAFIANTPMGGVSPWVMSTNWSVWLSNASRVVPKVYWEPEMNEVNAARFSTNVCIGRTAWCRVSTRSGAVALRPSVALSRAVIVDGPGSVATVALSSSRIRLRWAPALSSLTRRWSVAAPNAARMPRVWSSRPRPVAASTSRSLLIVVWKITVDNSVSSGMWALALIAGASVGPSGSTSCTEETAKTLEGTTRAVTVCGMSLAYCGLRSMCTKLGWPWVAGTTSLTEPTSSPWYLTSDWLRRPSPM